MTQNEQHWNNLKAGVEKAERAFREILASRPDPSAANMTEVELEEMRQALAPLLKARDDVKRYLNSLQ